MTVDGNNVPEYIKIKEKVCVASSIKKESNTNLKKCKSLCNNDPECAAFRFKKNKTCYIYDDLCKNNDELIMDNDSLLYFKKTSVDDFKLQKGKTCSGEQRANIMDVKDQVHCASKCKSFTGKTKSDKYPEFDKVKCNAFVYGETAD